MAGETDSRKEYIFSISAHPFIDGNGPTCGSVKDECYHMVPMFYYTAESFFGLKILDDDKKKLNDDLSLSNFLDNLNYMLLSCARKENTIYCTNQVISTSDVDNVLIFFKIKNEPIKMENLHQNVFVSSMVKSPLRTIYYYILRIYSPLLSYNSADVDTSLDPKLLSSLKDFENRLRAVLIQQSKSEIASVDNNSSLDILTLLDEVNFWKGSDDQYGRAFADLLEPLAVKYLNLNENLDFTSIEDLLDYTFSVLDDVWKKDTTFFPESRMENIMEIIGNDLVAVVQRKFRNFDFWRDDLKITDEPLRNAIAVCEKWILFTKELTTLYWPNYDSHKWSHKMFTPLYLVGFVRRLSELHNVLAIYYKFKILFDEEERKHLTLNSFFSPFKALNVLQYNEYTEPLWKDAVATYESRLTVLDREAALKLKIIYQNFSSSLLQLFQVFQSYEELLVRPLVQNMLLPERQYLLEQLMYYLSSINTQGDSELVMSMDIPQTVANLIKARQDEEKVEFILRGKNILADLNGYNDFSNTIETLRSELRNYQNLQFTEWVTETSTMLRMKGTGLRPDDVVIHFEEGKLMSVNFSKRLVNLIRETRQLKALGYPITTEILNAAEKAQSSIIYAKALNKIATFHNTIGDQIIRSQKGMMLKSARELARLVQSQHVVTWKDLKEVDDYIKKLQNIVQRLSKENYKLGLCHYNIMKKVSQLVDLDIYKQTASWHSELQNIRKIIQDVEKEFTNSITWRNHIDWQIYKVMECQYRTSLLTSTSFMSEFNVELYISENTIKCHPTISQLKKKFLIKLKTFLLFPKSMPYFGDENIYIMLIDYNASRVDKAFQLGSLVFDKLQNFIKSLYDWASIATISIDSYIEQYLNSSSDWERNLKTSKFLAQELAKFTRSSVKVECFIISLARFWDDLEAENSKCWKKLTTSLKGKILDKVMVLETFTRKALAIIDEQPSSVEEYIEIHSSHQKLINESEKMSSLLIEIEEHHGILKTWTGEVMSQTEDVKALWSNYQSALSSFSNIFSKKAEALKQKLLGTSVSVREEIDIFYEKWNEMKPKKEYVLLENSPMEVEKYFDVIKNLKEEWTGLNDKISLLRNDLAKFNMDEPEFVNLETLEEDIRSYEETWAIMQDFKNDVKSLADEEWIAVRKNIFKRIESFLSAWDEKLLNLSPSAATIRVRQGLDQFQGIAPYLKFFLGETFTEKHWHEIFNLFGKPYKPVHEIVFGDILFSVSDIEEKLNEIKEINNRASAEVVIRQALVELDIWDIEAKFTTAVHLDSKGNAITLIKDFKSIMNKIGDNQSLLQSVAGAAGTAQFLDRIALWEKKLADVDQNIRNLSQVQQKWVYLEPILNKSALEQSRFGRISKEFRHLLSEISKHDFRITHILKINSIGSILENILLHLEHCQKSLLNYLEEKRLKFPRFYFISDSDLLEMLGQPNKQDVLQSHLKKVFPGIQSVLFEESGTITAFTSAQGEIVNLRKSIAVSGSIEVWLEELAEEMKSTLRILLFKCLDEPDPLKYPSQILCLCEQIHFTKRCEEAISRRNLKGFLEEVMKKYRNYTYQITGLHLQKNDTNGVLLNLKLKSLLIDSIQHLKILQLLINSNVTSLRDWNWEKCVRFYMKEEKYVIIRIGDASFNYSYEYQGNQSKLVHTELTDKCYLTLTQALHMGFGGNPYGPAGTGKTESVKALGALLGRQVLVFNCDEGLDVQSLTRIMVGIVKCGAWGCFDEFNRLEEKTLSLISLQISEIQGALKSKLENILLLNKQVKVNFNSGIFITLNPAGKGYGGRQKLPESLKTLFRPVVMSKPDDTEIAGVILHCEGFKFAEKIAHKLVTVFNMAKNILPHRGHYDWGLRALKTVVSGCGHFLQEYLIENESANEEMEYKIVVQAVQLNTLCKLTYHDGLQFMKLLEDIFPGVKVDSSSGNDQLIKLVQESFKDLKLTHNERQVQKCLELCELLKQRMGVVIVGPAKSGKSTIVSLLKSVLLKQGISIRHDIISPKSVSRNELLGYIDLDTRQWNDGILTNIAQKVYNEHENVTCWIHCDGDVDPEWIESLNSVLDDNHLLTLPSGWRIHFGDNVHFIFETHELSHASPATISRMGIVFLSEEDLKVELMIDAWLNEQTFDSPFNEFVRQSIYSVISWISENGEFIVSCPLITTIKSCFSLMDKICSKLALGMAFINGIGSNLTKEAKGKFCEFVFKLIGEESLLNPKTSLDFYYDEDNDMISEYQLHDDFNFQSYQLIPIPFIRVATDTITSWLLCQDPVLIVGPPGSGKRLLIRDCVKNVYNTELITVECNPQLSSSHVVDILHQSCILVTSNARRFYRPRNTEKLILHFSHINLVFLDKWGSRMLLEFFRQLTSNKGFYDDNLEWVSLENVHFIYTSSTLENVSSRFISDNHILYLRAPVTTEMNHIYNSFLKDLNPSMEMTYEISELMVSIFHQVENFFRVSAPELNFCQRDLNKWCMNLIRYDITSKEYLSEAFLNESRRLFKDKLITTNDMLEFEKLLKSTLEHGKNSLIKYTDPEGYLYVSEDVGKQNSQLVKSSFQHWNDILQKNLLDYEGDIEDGNPILTTDIIVLISKLECILTELGGCILIGGKVGIGRKTALKIVAKRQNAVIYTPKISDQYTEKHFKNDLKNSMHIAGVNGEQCYFFLEDYQLTETYILNMLNCVISSGEVPGLYNTEEFNTLITAIKSAISDSDFEGSISQYFKKRVCENFHLILSFDTDNKQFIQQIKGNPVLYNYSYLINVKPFSSEAMSLIPMTFLSRQLKYKEPADETCPVVQALAAIHNKVGEIKNISPLSFFILIKTFIRMKKTKGADLESRKAQLQAGISKITEAQNIVEELKQEAHEQEALLQEKQAKSNAVLEQISLTMANASMKRSEMEELRRKTEEENVTLQIRKQEIDKELAEIEPILQDARAAVGNIKSESITEIRSLRAPTTIIRDILEAVLRLMGIQDTSWNSMKTFLSQRGVRDEIRFFDASQITKDDRDAVQSLLQSRKDSFIPANAKRASLAAAPLAAWVTANVQYSLVLEKIRPLTREQNKLEKNINDADLKIEELGSGLQSVDEVVSKLQDHLKASTKEGAEIELHLHDAQKRISAAEELVIRLSDEYKIWVKEHTEINSNLDELWRTCVLAAAFISYLSDTSEKLRSTVLEEWKQILGINQNFSLFSFFSSDHELITWSHEGLPSDEYSRLNGIITLHSMVPPLLLDPLSVAASWLKNHFKDDNLNVISHHSETFLTSLEHSIRFGRTVVLEISSSIPCIIMPILQQNFIYQGPRKMVYVGEKLVDYNQNFKLFLVAQDFRNNSLAYRLLPCPIINFKTSKAGLSEQLLDCALHVEKPALEQQRLTYIKEEENLKLKLHQMQEDVLHKLAHAQGDILQNQDLLKSLEITKESSNEIIRTLNDSTLLKENLNKERDTYKYLADYGANLCFACMHLNSINDMYQLSISTFKKLFEISLSNNQLVDTMSMKCKNLLNLVYHYVSRSLKKSDILTFALHLTHVVCPEKFENNEWEVFIGKLLGDQQDNGSFSEEDIPPWIEADRVPHVIYLQNTLPSLFQKINLKNDNFWLDFMHSADPEPPSHINLSAFQFVLIVQALCPDRLYNTLVNFVLRSLGLKFIQPPTLKMNKLYLETTASEPILIIASSGNDPSKDISILSAANQISHLHEFAAGPGCEEQLLKLIHDAATKGFWIIVKNLHLISYRLPLFEKELRSIAPHDKFRLWLITEPSRNLSAGFLNICLKITYEAPPGIKRNMERIYDNWINQNHYVINEDASKVMFTLAWLHAILQERRTYIPQGWTSYYEFNDADLECARDIVNRLFSKVFKSDVNWNYLRGLFEIAIYGGRINNTYDLRILSTYLSLLFKKDLIDNPNFQIAPNIRVPKSVDFKEHLVAIKSLPEADNPDFFGLPKNVNGIWQREACLNAIIQLKALHEDSHQEEATTFEEDYGTLFPIINHWKKLQVKNLTRNERSVIGFEDSPISTFFTMEMNFAISIVACISESLESLEVCLKEGKFSDETTFHLAQQLKSQQVPEEWDKIWNGPNNTLLYLQSVVSRTESIHYLYDKWMEENNVFDLAQIFNVERFLAALKQQASRFLKVPIENLTLNANIGSSVASIMAGSVIITGLLVEGASISYNELIENSAESSNISVVPNILLSWLNKEIKDVERNSSVSIPLYLTDRRDKVVADLQVPCKSYDKEKWILAGTAFYIRS